MSNFKIGDIVQLKSGGPSMTIKGPHADKNDWFVVWFSEDHSAPHTSCFPEETLKKYESQNDF